MGAENSLYYIYSNISSDHLRPAGVVFQTSFSITFQFKLTDFKNGRLQPSFSFNPIFQTFSYFCTPLRDGKGSYERARRSARVLRHGCVSNF